MKWLLIFLNLLPAYYLLRIKTYFISCLVAIFLAFSSILATENDSTTAKEGTSYHHSYLYLYSLNTSRLLKS